MERVVGIGVVVLVVLVIHSPQLPDAMNADRLELLDIGILRIAGRAEPIVVDFVEV